MCAIAFHVRTHFDDGFCFADERLGKMFKAAPPTEDVYVFQNNGPSFDSA